MPGTSMHTKINHHQRRITEIILRSSKISFSGMCVSPAPHIFLCHVYIKQVDSIHNIVNAQLADRLIGQVPPQC